MRFLLTVALKYLVPRSRQLSGSIISLVSVLVISLVVWLVILFLSVTEGIEKKWVEQLVAFNAPIRMTPTDAYYRSYYYQIDEISLDSNYNSKTIGEKLIAHQSNPYDPTVDIELPYDFPPPERHLDGSLKDPVKEGWEAIKILNPLNEIRPQEYEVSFGNLRLNLIREKFGHNDHYQAFVNQASYVVSHDASNTRLKQMLIPFRNEDYNNLLNKLSYAQSPLIDDTALYHDRNSAFLTKNLKKFFSHIVITKLSTNEDGFILYPAFFPEDGFFEGVGIIHHNEIRKVVIPENKQEIEMLNARLKAFGFETMEARVIFDQKQMHIASDLIASPSVQLVLNDHIPFHAKLVPTSIEKANSLSSLKFEITGNIQGTVLKGTTFYNNLEISEAYLEENLDLSPPLWLHSDKNGKILIPKDDFFGDGILIAKQFQNSGVCIGDQGHLCYYTPTATSVQEQRIPVFVAGFYDPGMTPIGNKLLFADPNLVPLLRGNLSVSDTMLGNGINIWLNDISKAKSVKNQLIHNLESREIEKYWNVQSFEDYDFAKPILQQLESDKNLFTLIAIIILVVACSNIISMLILLVNDKKHEIGILQSLGTSPKRIAAIFGMCGFFMGLISCVIGSIAAIITLHYLQSLVNFLSLLQGHEAFQSIFYGAQLPNELSFASLLFVILATMVISLLAGITPAIKAARIRPSEILKAE
ncbi:MAG: FtsX-like permease family protein [Chlamydiales bacterium]